MEWITSAAVLLAMGLLTLVERQRSHRRFVRWVDRWRARHAATR
jgi:hypothetical protein